MGHFSLHASIQIGAVTITIGTDHAAAPTTEAETRLVDFFQYAKTSISHARMHKSISTSVNYTTAIRSLRQFIGRRTLPFPAITPLLIADYEHYLKRRGVSLNTISCYMRTLRAIYNRAVEEGVTPQQSPFRLVFTGRENTRKRSITAEDIRCIRDLSLDRRPRLRFTRDIFLFCFYACGMPFIDVACLRYSQLRDGYLYYTRHKTGQRVSIKILPCMQRIIDRYGNKPIVDDQFVFPILSNGDFNNYLTQLSLYNRRLITLCRMSGLDSHLSSYVARHTWASLAHEELIDIPIISKGLGHTSVHTTQVYMREINDTRLDEANETLLSHVLNAK